jgi:hypothetical protein
LFRLFGYNVAFGVVAIALAVTAFRRVERWGWWGLLIGTTFAYGPAMTYDRIVGFIGPFEMLEYVALRSAYAALVLTWPFGTVTVRTVARDWRKRGDAGILDLYSLCRPVRGRSRPGQRLCASHPPRGGIAG